MKIAIAGAGLAGLAAGTWLQGSGHQVEIFEAATQAGGRAHTIRRPGTDDLVDVGTQYFHSNYRRALSLIKSVGLTGELARIRGRTRFFDDRVMGGSFTTGHRVPYIASGSLFANMKMTLRGAVRLGRHLIDPFAVLERSHIDSLSVGEAVRDPFEWEYNARALIAAGALVEPDPDRISYLHLIRLMRIIVMTDYLTLNGGIASLHEALASRLDISFETPVAGLLKKRGRVTGLRLAAGRQVEADHAVIATPPAVAAGIVPGEWQEERAFLSSIEQPPAIVVTLFLDRPLEDKIWSYVFRPDHQRIVSFCVEASRKNPAMGPSGKSALQAWICHPASEVLLPADDVDVVRMVTAELSRNFEGLDNRIEHTHVHKVKHAIPQAAVGHNARALRFLKIADRREGVDFCGDYLSGGYMECALWSAERAVMRLRSAGTAQTGMPT